MIIADRIQSNVQIALDTLRANKLRSSLTILGVVIGVSTVMAMAAIVQGIQDQIVRTIEIAGPTTFYVVKVFSQTPVNPDRLPKWIRVRPDLVEAEAERIKQLPEVEYAAIWAQSNGRLQYEAQRTQNVLIMGADDRYQEIQGGELLYGRWFTPAEISSGASVAVSDENAANRLFCRESIVGLLVGGIGVMAIMMVSVTSRTREIGIRKALGATRREILFQFLVEAATLTGFGGILGILIGLTFGRLATLAMNIDASVPVGLTVIAVMVSVSIGIIFGMLPAQRAAKLDPIDALRYE